MLKLTMLIYSMSLLGAPQRTLPPQVSDHDVMGALHSADDQSAVLHRAADLPPHTLQDDTVRAVAAELTSHRSGGAAVKAKAGGEAEFEYQAALIQILINQKNVLGVDALCLSASLSKSTQYAIAEFGDAAVLPLIRVAKLEHPDYIRMIGALDSLDLLLEDESANSKLSPQSRAAIHDLAKERLHNAGSRSPLLFSAARLSVATKDPDLRDEVETLVDNPMELNKRGIMDVQHQEWLSKRLKEVLNRIPRS